MKFTANHLLRCFLALSIALLGMPLAVYADVYVITNQNTGITAEDIRNIYYGEKELAGANKIRVYDNSAVKDEFLDKVLQIDATKYDSLWTRKSFRDGVTPPATKSNDEEVIAIVKSTPGAIGYVRSPPPPGVTLLKKF